jgi:ABC-type branched-subunit amino acid transport system substrate-binding protein
LNLHLVAPFFVDYEKEHVQNFVARFQQTYKSDPSQYAFQGYDTFYYFLQAMMQYGIHFEQYLQRHQPPLLQTQYVFRYNGSYTNGLINTGSCLINYTPAYTIEQR